MAASKQASKHTHARAQCSNASVGLAQARPNYTLTMDAIYEECGSDWSHQVLASSGPSSRGEGPGDGLIKDNSMVAA